MSFVQKLVTQDSFDARGVLVPAGHIATFDTEKLSGKEEHIKDIGDFQPAVVEISAIAPTGPNPTVPQQIPADAVQGPGGGYMVPGKHLVGEVTNPAEARIDDRGLRSGDENAASEELRKIMGEEALGANPDRALQNASTAKPDSGVEGTVAEVTANLGTKTDDQLRDLRDAEAADKNRAGVLKAIDAELEDRAANKQ